MADSVTKEDRSLMMSAMRAKDTGPELTIQRRLHRLGFRYSLHSIQFPEKPDMVFRKHRSVIFYPRMLLERVWLRENQQDPERDAHNLAAVEVPGWRHLVIWECSFRQRGTAALEDTVRQAAEWLREGTDNAEIGAQSM